LTVLEDDEEEESLSKVTENLDEDNQEEAGDHKSFQKRRYDAINESFRNGINSSTELDLLEDAPKVDGKIENN
jgi:hypothetical protein